MYKQILSLHDKKEFLFVLKSFLIWRIIIFIIAIIAIRYVPLFSHNYLGGGFSNYQTNPLFWGHFNFDGEHYLSIARDGYKPLEYFFFPLFPLIMRYFSNSLGLIVSNIIFLLSLVGLYKLIKIDFKENIAKLTIILLLVFPTSFYFGMYYTESIFLCLIVWSFYFVRKSGFLASSVLAAAGSAARVIGAVMAGIIFIELLVQKKKSILALIISPLGALLYIYYLWRQTGDPLIFLHQVSIFGEQRSSKLVLLPQVIYRYIFKILPYVNYHYFPNVFTSYLEFILGILFLGLVILSFFKLRLSYAIYAFFAYLIPTLAGSFSSMPRYGLVIFPFFILASFYIDKLPRVYKYFIIFGMLILMGISTVMFWRGYWLS